MGVQKKIDSERGLSTEDLNKVLDEFIEKKTTHVKRMLILPPDITRFYSRAGYISNYLYQRLHSRCDIYFMPALGTHDPMSNEEIDEMFGEDIPKDRFLPHFWRTDVKKVGELPSSRVRELSEGAVEFSMDVAVNKLLLEEEWDLIVSVGQVVPHEVIGMANYTKNILVGVGGSDTIHKSHFLGAAYGMERIMGKAMTPVRAALNEGFSTHLDNLPIEFILTVVGKIEDKNELLGIFIGEDDEAYFSACELSQSKNIDLVEDPIKKAIVYLDPKEFKTTWLGNKAIYRTRMAMADDGELIILAPGLDRFGEDREIDKLIREFGYNTTEETLASVEQNPDLANNLSAAAHLIHGSSEGRFKVTYCPKDSVTKEEIESVNYDYLHYDEAVEIYQFNTLKDGWNNVNGEDIFYISNPALGLWAVKSRFENAEA